MSRGVVRLLAIVTAIGLTAAGQSAAARSQAGAPPSGAVGAPAPQGPGGPGGGAVRGGRPAAARASAPADFTGYWVSIVTTDWRWRMVTPPRGDFANIPVNEEARKVGEMWDPARDEAAGEACKGYAAPAIMREPGRLRVSWEDDDTLKIETDAGMQTRLFHFSGTAPAGLPPTWQGHSVARWETAPRGVARPQGLGLGLGPRFGAEGRSLQVTTTQIRPGYLRKNGIPFSANAVVNEYYERFNEPKGSEWFVVTTVVTDPVYLNDPWVTNSLFRKEPDGSRWDPTPCRVR